MKKIDLKSREILELESQLLKNEKEAQVKFWELVQENGTPFIQELDGDSENNLVTFIFKGDKDTENVLLIPEVEDCKFLDYKYEKVKDTDIWYLACSIKNDWRMSYSLSVNDPLNQEWDDRFEKLVPDSQNKTSLFIIDEEDEDDEGETISYIVMPKAREFVWIKDNPQVQKGELHRSTHKPSKREGDMDIHVYTPYGYNKENGPYNFLTLSDGWAHLEVLDVKNVLDNLIAEGKIPPVVALFVEADETREEDLTCGDEYREILTEELIPWVREGYNISNNPEECVISGLSLGGLMSSYIGLKHSDIFGNVLSQSGSYWCKPEGEKDFEGGCWMAHQFKNNEKLPLKFYLNVGALEEKEEMLDTNSEMKDVLEAKGYDVEHVIFNGGHDYLCWGEGLADGLIALIGK